MTTYICLLNFLKAFTTQVFQIILRRNPKIGTKGIVKVHLMTEHPKVPIGHPAP